MQKQMRTQISPVEPSVIVCLRELTRTRQELTLLILGDYRKFRTFYQSWGFAGPSPDTPRVPEWKKYFHNKKEYWFTFWGKEKSLILETLRKKNAKRHRSFFESPPKANIEPNTGWAELSVFSPCLAVTSSVYNNDPADSTSTRFAGKENFNVCYQLLKLLLFFNFSIFFFAQ